MSAQSPPCRSFLRSTAATPFESTGPEPLSPGRHPDVGVAGRFSAPATCRRRPRGSHESDPE
jgi:hypothetical protein